MSLLSPFDVVIWMTDGWPLYESRLNGFTSLKKLRPQSVTSRIQPGSDVIVCAEMDEQWGYVGAKSRQRWLFYAYDRIRRTVVAHVFGERTLATLERLHDSQHRLVHYTRTQYEEPLVESRYLYDPLGRRVAKRVWRRERDLTGWMSLSRKPQVTWYGWDGDRLTTIQNDSGWDGSRCRSQNRWSCMTKSSGII